MAICCYFGYKHACLARAAELCLSSRWAFSRQPLRMGAHTLCSSVGRALAPHRLVLRWLHLSIHFSNGLVCTLSLRWGWVFLERTRILSGIQLTTHFIDFFVVQTKLFVGSFLKVILKRQTCGQRSSRAAESKRWALGKYFSERICLGFLMSKCRGDWDPVLCTFWLLANREALRIAKFRFFLRAIHFFLGSRHCAALLCSQVHKKCTDLDLILLYILISGTYSKFARKNNFLVLSVCFPQPCSSAGRRFDASRSRLQNYRQSYCLHNKKIDVMGCKLDSTENPRSFEKYPTPP